MRVFEATGLMPSNKTRYRWAYSRARDARVVIVVGMHRSGTGLVAQILDRLGVFMGKELTGNQESVFFQTLNKDALDVIGCNWRCIDFLPSVSELDTQFQWLVEFVKRRMEAKLIGAHFGLAALALFSRKQYSWGWKDPRNSLMLPVWRRLFPGALVVHVYRDGRDVALSLLRRDLKREKGNPYLKPEDQRRRYIAYFALWEDYIRRINHALTSFESPHRIQFEHLLDDPESRITELAHVLGIQNETVVDAASAMVDRARQGRHLEKEFSWVAELSTPNAILAELGYT